MQIHSSALLWFCFTVFAGTVSFNNKTYKSNRRWTQTHTIIFAVAYIDIERYEDQRSIERSPSRQDVMIGCLRYGFGTVFDMRGFEYSVSRCPQRFCVIDR